MEAWAKPIRRSVVCSADCYGLLPGYGCGEAEIDRHKKPGGFLSCDGIGGCDKMSPEGREMFPNDGTSAIGLAQGVLFGFSQVCLVFPNFKLEKLAVGGYISGDRCEALLRLAGPIIGFTIPHRLAGVGCNAPSVLSFRRRAVTPMRPDNWRPDCQPYNSQPATAG